MKDDVEITNSRLLPTELEGNSPQPWRPSVQDHDCKSQISIDPTQHRPSPPPLNDADKATYGVQARKKLF